MPTLTLAFPLLHFVFLYNNYLIDYMSHLFILFIVCPPSDCKLHEGRESCLLVCFQHLEWCVAVAGPGWTYVEYKNEGRNEWTGYGAVSWARTTGFAQAHLSFTTCYFLTRSPYSRHRGLLFLSTLLPILVPLVALYPPLGSPFAFPWPFHILCDWAKFPLTLANHPIPLSTLLLFS